MDLEAWMAGRGLKPVTHAGPPTQASWTHEEHATGRQQIIDRIAATYILRRRAHRGPTCAGPWFHRDHRAVAIRLARSPTKARIFTVLVWSIVKGP